VTDRQTDRQTDGQNYDSQDRHRICWRGKNEIKKIRTDWLHIAIKRYNTTNLRSSPK